MSDESVKNSQVEVAHLTPEPAFYNGTVRVACLHCGYRSAVSNTNDDRGITIDLCKDCGLPRCNVCDEELEGCPAK